MSALLSFCLYFTSYAPLWLSIAFLDVLSIINNNQNITTEIISLIVIVLSSLLSIIIIPLHLFKFNDDTKQDMTLVCANEKKSITVEYLLTYILPLIAFDFTVWYQVVLFLLFYTIIGFLFIRHKYFSANIMLDILGYNFYDCELKNNDNISINKTVISRKSLTASIGNKICVKDINNEYRLNIE